MPAQQKCNIDYIGVLDYLRDNQKVSYSDPEQCKRSRRKSSFVRCKGKRSKGGWRNKENGRNLRRGV